MLLLVVLHDERCAIVRNNEVVLVAHGDAEGIDGAVQQFMTMTQVSDVLDPAARGRAGAGDWGSGSPSAEVAPPEPGLVPRPPGSP